MTANAAAFEHSRRLRDLEKLRRDIALLEVRASDHSDPAVQDSLRRCAEEFRRRAARMEGELSP